MRWRIQNWPVYFVRTLIHLDAEARMTTYEDEEGKKRSSLSLIQRTTLRPTLATCGKANKLYRWYWSFTPPCRKDRCGCDRVHAGSASPRCLEGDIFLAYTFVVFSIVYVFGGHVQSIHYDFTDYTTSLLIISFHTFAIWIWAFELPLNTLSWKTESYWPNHVGRLHIERII